MTMGFHEAMDLVEYRHPFPTRENFHGRRTGWLLERSGLTGPLAGVQRITVAGSMGKASTSRFLAFILQALPGAGRVLLATKPPMLETPEGNLERYQLLEAGETGSRWLDPDSFTRFAQELAPLLEEMPAELGRPAPYDLRCWVLARAAVEPGVGWLIQEANIGLRDDPARTLPPPAVTVLTPIREEHHDLLLPPPAEAALAGLGRTAGPVWHKAGDVWPGTAVVLGHQEKDVEAACLALLGPGRPLLCYGRDYEVLDSASDFSGSRARMRLGPHQLSVATDLLGHFQVENAAQAAATIFQLHRDGHLGPTSWDDVERAIRQGLARADSPGRMQRWGDNPTTLFSVGGGISKTAAAVASLEQLLPKDSKWVGCVSFMERLPDPRETLAQVLSSPRLTALVATEYRGDASSPDAPASTVGDWIAEQRPELPVEVEPDVAAAVARARQLAGTGDLVFLLGPGLGQALQLF